MVSVRLQQRRRLSGAALALPLVALGATGFARAACVLPDSVQKADSSAGFISAVYRPDGAFGASLIRTSFGQPSIVGLWKFEMLAKSTRDNTNPMPDGTLIDFGTAAWHSDGTELINSGSRNPADGDFCQGVWAQVGPGTFTLNHMPLAWTNGAYTGPAVLRERVTVDYSGMHYSGDFKLTQYLATMTPGHEFDETTALITITGTITAKRITP
jgi:hypothetical protein